MSDQPEKPKGVLRLRTVTLPRDANPGGDVFGGWTLSQMDLAAGSFAARLAEGRVATVSIDAMHFLRPIAIGEEVSCYCRLMEAGETSIKVLVETWTQTRASDEQAKVTEGLFTFVAVDENGDKRSLPESARKPE